MQKKARDGIYNTLEFTVSPLIFGWIEAYSIVWIKRSVPLLYSGWAFTSFSFTFSSTLLPISECIESKSIPLLNYTFFFHASGNGVATDERIMYTCAIERTETRGNNDVIQYKLKQQQEQNENFWLFGPLWCNGIVVKQHIHINVILNSQNRRQCHRMCPKIYVSNNAQLPRTHSFEMRQPNQKLAIIAWCRVHGVYATFIIFYLGGFAYFFSI